MKTSRRLLATTIAALVSPAVYATNGMNLEGYGPIATAMGGASMAYDNGNAAVMNNPATLGLRDEGDRLDIAMGRLGPDVEAKANTPMGTMSADSKSDQFFMPAIGWTRKKNQLTYGVGVFAQGGMGTEYASDSFVAGPTQEKAFSQVSVGRLIAPLTYNVDSKLTVGGSIDFVWAGMDIVMPINAAMVDSLGIQIDASGPGAAGLAIYDSQMDYAQFNFANDSDFTGEARGNGFAGKLGVTYKVNPKLTLGATYHSETSLGDLESRAAVNFWLDAENDGVYEVTPDAGGSLSGDIKVKDFQWPATYAIGAAYQATDTFMVAVDLKQINWSDTMDSFKMSFEGDDGTVIDADLPQGWDNQLVYQIGFTHKINDKLLWRAGYNHGDNPIPDKNLSPLFPAIVEDHYTLGVGYGFSNTSMVNASLTYGAENSATNDRIGVEATHSQLNMQVMYSARF